MSTSGTAGPADEAGATSAQPGADSARPEITGREVMSRVLLATFRGDPGFPLSRMIRQMGETIAGHPAIGELVAAIPDEGFMEVEIRMRPISLAEQEGYRGATGG